VNGHYVSSFKIFSTQIERHLQPPDQMHFISLQINEKCISAGPLPCPDRTEAYIPHIEGPLWDEKVAKGKWRDEMGKSNSRYGFVCTSCVSLWFSMARLGQRTYQAHASDTGHEDCSVTL